MRDAFPSFRTFQTLIRAVMYVAEHDRTRRYNEPVRKILLVVVMVIAIAAILFVIVRSATPAIDLPNATASLGQATPVTVHVQNARGVKNAAAWVDQNG